MSITKEQVTDLRDGDVVRVTGWYGLTVEGPVSASDAQLGTLWMGQYLRLSYMDAGMPAWCDAADATLTVVSRAPRPLYVNHPRPEPVPGDVVRDADSDGSDVWIFAPLSDGPDHWRGPTKAAWITTRRGGPDNGISRTRSHLPARLRLLVDGETGQVIP